MTTTDDEEVVRVEGDGAEVDGFDDWRDEGDQTESYD